MGTRTVALVGGILLAAGDSALASTIRVPEDYRTVLAGVDAAFPGDSVLVGPGTWTALATRTIVIFGFPRSITACAFPRGGVTILGTAGRDATILNPSVEDTGAGLLHGIILAERVGEGLLQIEGFTLTGARRPGGAHAVAALAADGLIVRSCRFFENESIAPQGIRSGAVIAGAECDVEVIDSLIDANASLGGMIFVPEGNLTIRRCRFEENRGVCVQFDSEDVPFFALIEDSEFIRNRGRGYGVAVNVTVASFEIRGCRFVENVAEELQGGAVYVNGCFGRIQNCVFERDSCVASNLRGGAIWWEASSGPVEQSTFVGCHSALGGAAFFGQRSGTITFARNVVAHSTGGAAVSISGPRLTGGQSCNDYWLNEGGNFGIWWPTPSDFFEDPIFCAAENSDYTLREDSPCVVGGCGQVGALGIGCEAISVEPTSWGKIKNLYYEGRR